MSERTSFANQIPIPKLDPLLMGEVMGTDAFTEGDWVLLRFWENKPTKVTRLQHNFVCVALEGGEDFVDTLVHFYPEELGYPLDHRFWSNHQKGCYLRCHVDPKLLTRWPSEPSNPLAKDKTSKLCALGLFLSLIALVSKVIDYIARWNSVSTLVWLIH